MSTSGSDRSIIRKKKELEDRLVQMGYPEVFGRAIANQLGTMKTMNRMLAYLEKANPGSAEEIADEMLAICEERFQWQRKKEAEFYSRRYHQMLRENSGML